MTPAKGSATNQPHKEGNIMLAGSPPATIEKRPILAKLYLVASAALLAAFGIVQAILGVDASAAFTARQGRREGAQ
jgi:hypothetical protein